MHEYDVAFKLVLKSVDIAIRELTGTDVARWLNVELPEIRNTRVDLLGETAKGDLIHIELQSTNDPKMPLRMAEYCLRVLRVFDKLPHQVLVYLGEPPLTMASQLKGPALEYSYRSVDIRELDGERLLESSRVGDNIIAILTKARNPRAMVRRIVERIAKLEPSEQEAAIRQLFILAGLRKLGDIVSEETERMPITTDILEHDVIGREYKKGELKVLRQVAQKRFGSIPAWANERFSQLTIPEIDVIALRLLDVATLEELFETNS